MTTRYVRGDIIDELFARIEAGGDAYWYLTDRLGSIRDITDNTGDVVNTLRYDGFGNIVSETDDAYRGRYAWNGREFDVETELQYNRARYYDAKTGRWTSQDPLGFDAGDSNLYRYVMNQPKLWSDPSGLASYSWDVGHGRVYFRNKIWEKAVALVGIRTDVNILGGHIMSNIPVYQPPNNWLGWDAIRGNNISPGFYLRPPDGLIYPDGSFDFDLFTPARLVGVSLFFGLTVAAAFIRDQNSLINNDDYYWVQEVRTDSEPWRFDLGGGHWNKPHMPNAYPFQREGANHLLLDHPGAPIMIKAEHQFYDVSKSKKGAPWLYISPTENTLGKAYEVRKREWEKSPINHTFSFKTHLVYKCPGVDRIEKLGYIRWGYNLALTGGGGRVTINPDQTPTWVPLNYSPGPR